ncbi:DNA-binding protein [Azonexus sp. R2A61]|uniref:DNA-binding protein n=1 Tax=Azonexus sp. R2A61 TaxID=2744443 RepID=UPI001F20BE15|nr:DNA-binding protein [Azonexus sp. R2A61]
MSTEAKIIAEIEALKVYGLETQYLYREVCTILFFRYGITPTANKLYQYVRKGSMSAPAEALAKFWSDLREKSRVRIEHPDLPEGLKTAAGELVASLWSQAQTSAQDGLVVFRQEAQEKVSESLKAVATADQARVAAEAESNQSREALRAANERILDLERHLAGEHARTQSLEQQIESAKRQHTTLEAALAEARKDYSAELEKSRQELRRSEDRLAANEKRALLEIDHERQMVVKAHRELLQLRNSSLENEEQLRFELAASKAELANTRQQLGVTEGRQEELKAGNEKQLEELAALRLTLVKQETQLALLQRELELALAASKQLQESIASKPAMPKVARRNRKI